MNTKVLRALSYVGITIVMFFSIWYTLKTYREGDPKWNFMILGFGIAILLGMNLIKSRKY
ncbi:MAG: hypothetical protein ABJN36_12255 [Cyclobacteriaceae bacterium]